LTGHEREGNKIETLGLLPTKLTQLTLSSVRTGSPGGPRNKEWRLQHRLCAEQEISKSGSGAEPMVMVLGCGLGQRQGYGIHSMVKPYPQDPRSPNLAHLRWIVSPLSSSNGHCSTVTIPPGNIYIYIGCHISIPKIDGNFPSFGDMECAILEISEQTRKIAVILQWSSDGYGPWKR